MQTWFTSDLHLGHQFMAEFRGFDSVADHDITVLKSIAKRAAGHRLFILGDIVMGGWVQNLPKVRLIGAAEVHIIIGNHDRVFAGNKNAFAHMENFIELSGADSVSAFGSIRVDGQRWMLSHFPYDDFDAQGDEERYMEYRLRDEGIPLLHGHTHSSNIVSQSDRGTKQVHVGWDAWRRPVSIDYLAERSWM